MRIEELNEHLVEDSDGLWQKHTLKEFRHVTPRDGQTWRELYLEKLADREEKMKSITSSIKARQQAREEPVRKAAVLNSLPRRPPMGGGFSSRSIFSSPNTGGSSQSNLMKQTIKMAKHRQGMLSFRRK
jgi:transcription elongation factor B polypeptide 3